MLESLRKSAGGWVAKIFLGLLVLSFAVWGIADIFTGFGGQTVAKVGATEISSAEFQRAFQTETRRFGRQVGRPLGLSEARQFGIDRRVLGQMISQATLDEDARRKGLGVSDDRIARDIVSDRQFSSGFNSFSRAAFEGFLGANGYSETGYIAERKELARRQQLAEGVAGGLSLPKTLQEVIHTFQNEARAARFVTLNDDSVPAVADPDPTTLSSYFETNKARFKAPEYRAFSYLLLQPETLADRIEITDSDVEAAYLEREASFTTAERRAVRQIGFDTVENAAAARARLGESFTFDDLAAEMDLTAEDINLGIVTRAAMVDESVAAAAFGLESGAVSQPVEGRFRPVLVEVGEIIPGGTRVLAEVSDQLRRTLALERANDELLDLFDRIEDDRAAGLTLKEIAAKNDLDVTEIAAIDRNGRDRDAVVQASLPNASQLIAGVHETEVGVETDALQIGTAGSLWYEVTGVTPARDRTLDEAREMVVSAWKAEELQAALTGYATAMLERVRGGDTIDALAADENLVITRTAPLKRTDATADLNRAALERLFSNAVGESFQTTHANGTDRLIVFVTSSDTPPFDPASANTEARAGQLTAGMIDDLLTQYVASRRDDYGATINQTVLDLSLGITSHSGH